jgi:putative N6-adenine-specific DNA methylase
MVRIAKENAKNIGLDKKINFEVCDFREFKAENWKLEGTLVSNPPYWERLRPENLEELYIDIDWIFRKNPNMNWGIISSFMEFDEIIKQWMYKKRKLYNWGEMCYFWRSINH